VGTIERKGSENLAKPSATVVDQPHLGQAPGQRRKALSTTATLAWGKRKVPWVVTKIESEIADMLAEGTE